MCAAAMAVMLLCCRPNDPKKGSNPAPATKLIVNVDNFRLREKPGEDGKEMADLHKGEELTDLGEVSDFTTRMTIRGIAFDEPWLKVRTSGGKAGWVYAGAIGFDVNHASDLIRKVLEKRTQTFFGSDLSAQILAYDQLYKQVSNSEQFNKVYEIGSSLRDTLVRVLAAKVVVNDPENVPDFFWLEQVMPGFITQLVAEGTQFYLFWDYRQLVSKAGASQGMEDDDFIGLCLEVHSLDSVEYFYPSWFIQTWDYGGHSLLGRGIHQRIMSKMDSVLYKSGLFRPEITKIKNLWMNDIGGKDVTYWETKDKILKEMDSIIKSDYRILSRSDKIALETRKKQFENPDKNQIVLNQKSGSGE